MRVADEVDATTADQIAFLHLVTYISGCGAPMQPDLTHGVWNFQLQLGVIGAVSDRYIHVHAQTAGVWSAGGPRFATFSAFAADVLERFGDRR